MALVVFERGHAFDPSSFFPSSNVFQSLFPSSNYTVVYDESDGWIIQLNTPVQGVTYVGFFPAPGSFFIPTLEGFPPRGTIGQIEFADASLDTFVIFAELADLGLDIMDAISDPAGLVSDVDLFLGSEDTDVFFAGPGDDLAFGGDGADVLRGGDGNDVLVGEGGNNDIWGEAGDDVIVGGPGDDVFNGGAGVDLLSYAEASSAVTVTLATPSAQDTGGAGIDTLLSAFEQLEGSAFGDTLTGSGNDETFFGFDGDDAVLGELGDDTLMGGAGNDALFGADGDDQLEGGLGADAQIGDAGSDTVSYGNSSAGVTVDLATQTASGGDAQGDTLSGIENVIGSAQSDTQESTR